MLQLLQGATHYGPPRKPAVPRADSAAPRPTSQSSARRPKPPTEPDQRMLPRPMTARQWQSKTPMPLIGTPIATLPSERAGARKLHATLLDAFDRKAPIGYKPGGSISTLQLADEWKMLNLVASHLVKQMSSQCVEWSSVLELMRTRLELLWIGTGAALLQHERAQDAAAAATPAQDAAAPSEAADAAQTANPPALVHLVVTTAPAPAAAAAEPEDESEAALQAHVANLRQQLADAEARLARASAASVSVAPDAPAAPAPAPVASVPLPAASESTPEVDLRLTFDDGDDGPRVVLLIP